MAWSMHFFLASQDFGTHYAFDAAVAVTCTPGDFLPEGGFAKAPLGDAAPRLLMLVR